MKWEKQKKEIRSQVILFAVFLFVTACFRTAFADWSFIPSGSMEPTLYHGDYVWIDKTKYGPSLPFANVRLGTFGKPERGDIITFIPPHTDTLYVKRVIGIPGDTIRIEGSTIHVNGKKLPTVIDSLEEGVLIGSETIDSKKHIFQMTGTTGLTSAPHDIAVPEAKYFVLGDHRNNSADSRYWGFVDEGKIMGKVTHVAISFSSQRPLLSRFVVKIP